MATFSMGELVKSVFGDNNVAQQSHEIYQGGQMSKGGRRDRRSIPETKTLIKKYIHEQGGPCLILDICGHLDRKPSPHFRGILAEMVRDGELLQAAENAPGARLPRFWYALP